MFHLFSKKAHVHQKITIKQFVVFSKMFENLLSSQLLEFFDNILCKFQCGLEKVMELNIDYY